MGVAGPDCTLHGSLTQLQRTGENRTIQTQRSSVNYIQGEGTARTPSLTYLQRTGENRTSYINHHSLYYIQGKGVAPYLYTH